MFGARSGSKKKLVKQKDGEQLLNLEERKISAETKGYFVRDSANDHDNDNTH